MSANEQKILPAPIYSLRHDRVLKWLLTCKETSPLGVAIILLPVTSEKERASGFISQVGCTLGPASITDETAFIRSLMTAINPQPIAPLPKQ